MKQYLVYWTEPEKEGAWREDYEFDYREHENAHSSYNIIANCIMSASMNKLPAANIMKKREATTLTKRARTYL